MFFKLRTLSILIHKMQWKHANFQIIESLQFLISKLFQCRGAAAPARVGPGGNPSRRVPRGGAPTGVWGRAPWPKGRLQGVLKARRMRGGLGAEPPHIKNLLFNNYHKLKHKKYSTHLHSARIHLPTAFQQHSSLHYITFPDFVIVRILKFRIFSLRILKFWILGLHKRKTNRWR